MTPGWVLVVDDDATDRIVLFRLLEGLGYHATVVDSGAAAVELLRSEPFDLILLDLFMPGSDGYAVLEAMKSDARVCDVPVVVVSALDDRKAFVRAVEMGAEDYLDKPVDPVLLGTRINAVLERRRLRRQQREFLDVVDRIAHAAATAGKQRFESDELEAIVRRTDPLGHLARAVRQLGVR
jgi:DNA-binding response OmpR family regulator